MERLAVDSCGDAGFGFGGLLLGELLLGDFAGQILLDSGEAAVEKGLLHVTEEDVEAGAGADMGDTVSHGSGAEDCDGFDLGHKRVGCDSAV